MSIDTNQPSTDGNTAAASLTTALGQSERVKRIVEECAEDLSSVNSALATAAAPPRVAIALEKSRVVEEKVQDASDQLAIVNETLKVEVRERHALEDRVAVLTEQSEADRHASFHDPLTGLPNRALFNDRLVQGLAQAGRHEWTLAVMFLDLNNFKGVNDAYGHEAGDAVLQIISDRLRKITRRDDTICRHGGDEFLYLLAQISEEKDAAMIAKKLIAAIQAPCEITVGHATVTVNIGASIGIAMSPRHGVDAEQLVGSADAAMYEAKRDGAGYVFAVQA
jgi:diguanylate cyclase (GGDEF)-like protein